MDGFIQKSMPIEGGIDAVETTTLFPYDPELEQDNEINRENSKRLFEPEFIPYYWKVQKEFNLTDTATKIYGFLRFFLANATGRFYFTNEQISKTVNDSVWSVGQAIKELRSHGLIETRYKMKSDGGKIRFVTIEKSTFEHRKIKVQNIEKAKYNKNNIKDNKIINSVVERSGTTTTSGIETPKTIAQTFFDSAEKQEELCNELIAKGIPSESAIHEVQKFVNYWTELNHSGTKQRWQMEKTFEIQRRLNTWFQRLNFKSNNYQREGGLIL